MIDQYIQVTSMRAEVPGAELGDSMSIDPSGHVTLTVPHWSQASDQLLADS